MHFDPNSLSQPDRYKLLIGAIVPRPIAFVSTIGRTGALNLAPFSFFAGVSSAPLSLLFCPANKPDGSMKDTLINCLLPAGQAHDEPALGRIVALPGSPHATNPAQGQFVVNIVSEDFARQMAACAEPLPYGESEFDLSGLTPAPSIVVRPPRVAESPISFECRTLQVLHLNPGVPAGGNIVIGEIVHIHARDDGALKALVNDRHHVDPTLLRAIGRMGGRTYVRTADPAQRFEMPQGLGALKT